MRFSQAFSKKIKDLTTPQEVQRRVVTFGATYMSDIDRATKASVRGKVAIAIEFPDDLMLEIDEAIDGHQASINVLYDDDMQFIEVVGESFRQETLKDLFDREDDSWLAGFLMPEPFNNHDRNAVSVVAIDTGEGIKTTIVGYLDAATAKKVQAKVIKYLDGGAVIPILLKLIGGTDEKPTIGVLARAKTKKIKF